MKKFFLIILFLPLVLFSQPFLKTVKKPGLKELQLSFDTWRKSHDLNKVKHWKYYKRWEMDMQMHTNAKGEPDPETYLNEILKVNAQRSSASKKSSASFWLPIGPDTLPTNSTNYMENGMGRINCIAFHPTDPNTFFVGVAQGGVWKTSNSGKSWTPLTDNLPIMRISDIAIDPSNPNTMYISVCDFEYIGFGLYLNGKKRNTHYGIGVYKTTDGGQTWNPTGLSFQITQGETSLIRKVIVNKSNSSKLVACGVSGLYTSDDGGTTWNKRVDSLFWDLVQDPVNNNVLYAASGWVSTLNDGYAAVYKSTDFGQSWTMLNTGIPGTGAVQRIRLAVAPSDNSRIYAFAVNIENGFYGIYRSSDAGNSWLFLPPALNVLEWNDGTGSGGQGTYDLGFMVSPTNKDLIYSGGINIWGSTDGGASFNPVMHWTTNYGPTIHGDIHFIETQPSTGNVFVCSDGGIYRTQNIIIGSWADANNGVPWPTQWTRLGNGLAITSFYRISSSKNAKGRLIAGAQDNASFYYNGNEWKTVFGGDGMDNYLDPNNDQHLIGSSQYGNFFESYDDGNTSNTISSPNFTTGEWTSPLVYHENSGSLYIGLTDVVKSTDQGLTWSGISNFPPDQHELSAIAVHSGNPNNIWACKRVRYEYQQNGFVYHTTDGGVSWQNVTAGLPDSLYYTAVECGKNTSEAYISMAGLKAGLKVFKTSNSGLNWINISYNLPNVPVNCLRLLPGGELMAGTDLGVYILYPGANTWTAFNNGLPNVIVSDIEINQKLNKIYVCTFGRGIWGGDLSTITDIKPNSTQIPLAFELVPTKNTGRFEVKGNFKNGDLLEIYDILGHKVFENQLETCNQKYVNADLLPGIYFVRLQHSERSSVIKMMVE